MEAATQHLIETLLKAASYLPPNERHHYLGRAVADDTILAHAVDTWFDQHRQVFTTPDAWARSERTAQEDETPSISAAHVPGVPNRVSHFRILEKLGEGGMGVVYKARDVRLGRFAALKFLHPHLRTDATAKTRFVEEAKAASALDHPNIATVYEIGSTESTFHNPDGQPFIAMAYYAGSTCTQLIERGPLGIAEIVDIVSQTVGGLAAAHKDRVIHRDVKPSNLIKTSDGVVKLVDFGLARVGDGSITKCEAAFGSPAYMSPEQAGGDAVDHRTDIWSIGVVLYEMLAGRRPFPGEVEPAVLYSILNTEPAPVSKHRRDVPTSLQTIVAKCLSKDPRATYQTAEDLLRALNGVLDGRRAMKSDESATIDATRPFLRRCAALF